MDEFIEKLKITISDKAKKRIIIGNDFVKIKENNRDSSLSSIIIDGFKNNILFWGFSLDIEGFNKLSHYIDRKHFNKGCDGIIFIIIEKEIKILICELKSEHPKKRDYENQLKSSEAFVYYLIKAIKIFDNIDIQKYIKISKILFCTKINKPYTYPHRNYIPKISGIKKIGCQTGINYFNYNKLL